ncbi:hypothetical protein G6L37_00045 [Agrobacterium rubi]|nr:hypothetical protein [Agrobacterium rubi]NTF23640.1 hypothetical protein [Agrobacterium rubi]
MVERSKALQIYFKPGLSEDDLMLRVWHAARRRGRPQEIFRSMLREGLVQLVASGKLDDSIIEECGLDAIVERRRQRTAKHSDRPSAPQPAQFAPGFGYPVHPPFSQAPPAPVYVEPPPYSPVTQAPTPRHIYDDERRPSPPPAEPERLPPTEREISPPNAVEKPSVDRAMPSQDPINADGAKPQRKLGKLM